VLKPGRKKGKEGGGRLNFSSWRISKNGSKGFISYLSRAPKKGERKRGGRRRETQPCEWVGCYLLVPTEPEEKRFAGSSQERPGKEKKESGGSDCSRILLSVLDQARIYLYSPSFSDAEEGGGGKEGGLPCLSSPV